MLLLMLLLLVVVRIVLRRYGGVAGDVVAGEIMNCDVPSISVALVVH